MVSEGLDDPDLRGEITSLCRETARSFDMERSGSRWKCEVTDVTISKRGIKRYRFYIHDKKTGKEYHAEARLENNEDASWRLLEI